MIKLSPETLSRRRNLARKIIRTHAVDALLVQAEKNVSWLSGFSGDSTWLLLTQDSLLLISDFRYITQLEEECPGVETFIRSSNMKLVEALAKVVQKLGIDRLGVEGHVLTWETGDLLRRAIPDRSVTPINWEIEQLRSIKDADEIGEIKSAIHLAEKGLAYAKAILTPRLTERELARELEYALRRFGAEGLSFPAIVAVGDRAALPHYRPGDVPLSASPILLLDWGAKTRGGYCSDLTRTMLTGKADKKFEKVYRTVLSAQQQAIAAIAPGVTCGAVDALAREIITAAGFGKYFEHGLGHGIGLDVHELPRLARNSETMLKPGMVVTVEPGIYLPGWGGVRIEDDVLVTRQGNEVLSTAAKDWEAVGVTC